jgi:histidine triad (HIT) family protein
VKGEIPGYKIYEDSKCLAFLDIEPFSKGHLLVIPKKHSNWLWDMDSKDYSHLMEKSFYLANVLRKAFKTEWVEEVVTGIDVQHTHIHLLPRKKNDGLGILPTEPLKEKLTKEEMIEIANEIKKNLK